MLTQDDFLAPNMSGDGNLQRSSWKAEAIRRGDLKISGPFPITEETPLSEEEEKVFADKNNIDPSPLPTDAPSQSDSQQQAHVIQRQPSLHNGSLHEKSDSVERHQPPQEAPPVPEPKKSPTTTQETTEFNRQSNAEPISYSTPSPFPSIPESKMTPTKKKRKSGLRNVFRKMFGRKSKEESVEEEDPSRRHTYHRSDPGILTSSPERKKETASSQRISDLPIHELKPMNPLGQHLPFPMNVNAPQEASPPHDYLTFDVPPSDLGRRRATLPSVLLSQTEARALRGAIGGSVERLPTWDERIDAESLPSPQIGIALSSPPPQGAQTVQAKRRSRSAGALRDLAKARPSIERRRSAEIRYWRNSYQSGSIYSTATRPQTAKTIDTVRTIDTQDTVAQAPESVAETTTTQDPVISPHDQDISQIPIPVSAFNFGNLKNGFSDDEHDVEEVEVPPRSHKRTSIEERITYLEDNVRDLETSMRRISGRSNRQTIILENAPKGRRNRSSSATSDRQGSHHSSRSEHRSTSGRHDGQGPPSPSLGPLSAVDELATSNKRQTIILDQNIRPRPATAPQNDTSEQFAAVFAALKHERSARKTLERQVYSLQREVSDLHAIVNKFISHSPSYPTPSPDAIIASNEERLATPRAHPDQSLGFDSTGNNNRETIISKFSHSDSEAGDYSLSSSREDITSPEAWMTPKEESGFGSGFFSRSKSNTNVSGKGRNDDEMF